MKRPALLLWGVAAVAVGVCAIAYNALKRTDPSSLVSAGASLASGGPRNADDDVAKLRREVAVLRAEVALGRPAPAARPEGRAGGERRSMRDPEVLAEAERRRRDLMEGVETAFRGENSDPQWSSSALAALRAALDAPDVGLTARGMECRSRTCRVELPDDGSDKLAETVPLFANELAATLPNLIARRVVDPGGSATMILYLTRAADPR